MAASPRVRSVLISSNFPPLRGGAGVVYDQICRHLAGQVTALSVSRDYLTNLPIPATGSFDTQAPYPIVRIPLLRPPEALRRSPVASRLAMLVIDLPIFLRTFAVTAWLSLRARARVVCIGDLVHLGWMVWPLRYILRLKVIFYIHGEEISVEGTGLFLRLRRRCLSRAHAVIAVSAFARDLLVTRLRIDAAKILVVGNGVDLARFRPGPVDPAIVDGFGATGARVILSVGRLTERKGFDTLIDAMPAVLDKVPEALCLVAGEGPLRAELEERVRCANLGDRFRLLGPVGDPDLLALYRIAEIFAMPNRTTATGDTEGFGLVFLEANACGKPAVAGRAGGAVEAVCDGCNGLLVDGEDHREVSAALIRLLTDAPLYTQLSAGACAKAAVSGWASRAEAYQALCDTLVDKRGNPTARPRGAPDD
ncbi:MAG TPA: glycosyltransferase family 4 protein [Stellaceae bacterium]|jgi:phosphatidylinositol alpha-1,6-mannosyltransferase